VLAGLRYNERLIYETLVKALVAWPSFSHPSIWRFTMTDRVTGRDIILGILENMKASQEPLLYTTISPGLYDVYLHPDDFERLEGIFPTIADEAKLALDEAVDKLERGNAADGKKKSWFARGKAAEANAMRFPKPAEGWAVAFHPNADDDVNPGDLVIESTLALPEKQSYSGGAKTRRIRTLRSEGQTKLVSTKLDSDGSAKTASSQAQQAGSPTIRPQPRPENSDEPSAQFTWKDEAGTQTFLMKKPQIYAGRGGVDDWVDLKIEASTDISRRHFRIRRDEATGAFFIKDLSSYGTAVNGQKLRPGIAEVKGVRREVEVEDPLPNRATIVLADVLTIQFEAL
jgi:hypothetical protein